MTEANNKAKATISCDFNKDKTIRTYIVKKDDKQLCALSLNDRGYVRLYDSEDKNVAELQLNRERTLKNIGGYDQYSFVYKPIDINTLDGLMDIYKKIKDQEFSARNPNPKTSEDQYLYGEDKAQIGKLMTDFLDKFIFRDPESRAVLHEHLDKETPEDIKKRDISNTLYKKALQEKINSK